MHLDISSQAMLVGEHGLQRVGQKNGRRKNLTFVCFGALGLSCVGSSGRSTLELDLKLYSQTG